MRVESSPRRRGRTPNGPLPTGVMFTAPASASPVESGLVCATASPLRVSTCRGISRISRSPRAAVTLTSAVIAPIDSRTGTSIAWSASAIVTVRADSANPGRVTTIR